MAKRKLLQPANQLLVGGLVLGAVLIVFGIGLAAFNMFGLKAAEIIVNGRPVPEAQLALGQQVYELHCAACHGLEGEGQPNWKQPNADGVYPAPPHTGDGHTWHHADSLLLQIIADGGSMPNSGMPGYANTLTEEERVAVLAYIKTFWGPHETEFQQQVSQQAP